MKKKLTNNLGMRTLAVFFAILIWVIVVNVSDPVIESTYSGIPVEIINGDSISVQNKTFEILDGTDTITVTISAKRSINDLLGRDNIRAFADMSDLDMEKGSVRIKLETNKYNDKIESIKGKNDTLMVGIENLQKKQFSITPQINGDPEEGYIIGDTSLDQNVVTVQGPESIVSQIEKAAVEASVAGMTNSISTTSAIRFYDSNGTMLDSTKLTGNISAVNLKVDILATKNVGFRFNTSGELADEYGLADEITADVEEVMVAGKPSVLSGTTVIVIPGAAIDVEGKDETFTQTIDLNKYLPDNMMIADADFDGKITVTVPIEKMETREYVIGKDNLSVVGYDSKKQLISVVGDSGSYAVNIKGMKKDLDEIKPGDIVGTISVEQYMDDNGLNSLKAGVYRLPITIGMPKGVRTVRENLTVECRVRDLEK